MLIQLPPQQIQDHEYLNANTLNPIIITNYKLKPKIMFIHLDLDITLQ
jgi:hypothetical protein